MSSNRVSMFIVQRNKRMASYSFLDEYYLQIESIVNNRLYYRLLLQIEPHERRAVTDLLGRRPGIQSVCSLISHLEEQDDLTLVGTGLCLALIVARDTFYLRGQ